MEEVKDDVYTVVIETPAGTNVYEFYDLENAIEVMRYERDNCMDSSVYIIDFMGNILDIK